MAFLFLFLRKEKGDDNRSGREGVMMEMQIIQCGKEKRIAAHEAIIEKGIRIKGHSHN